ncbi:hypothetical protein H8F21_15230 [Pseudomonas sp. P66]|uniref:Uncharacterized protein n=1 Tax=Pseudomonas arcuscaelestis TaxID=2710591 RepID=A0ABS2C0S6_9PSED|nr:hypothetical protein [Pseudomonas arcuscaelestis]MBM5458918.1 hypothetical protein [Pseudomonas arcuscaelestis]
MSVAIHFYDAITAGKAPAEGQIVRYDSLMCDGSNASQALEMNVSLRSDVHVDLESAAESELAAMNLLDGESELFWAKLAHAHLTKPDCLHVGFGNTNRIDSFIRFALYRNLLPYPCVGLPANSHFLDVDTILRAVHILRPEEYPWTQSPNPAKATALHHFLMWEVKAVGGNRAVRVRELLAETFATCPKLVGHALKLTSLERIKAALGLDRGEVSDLESTTPSILVHPSIHSQRGFVLGLPVGVDITYPDILYVADLEADLSQLCDPSISSYQDLVRTSPNQSSRPLVRVSLGRFPFCAPLSAIRPADAARLHIDIGHVKRSTAQLRAAHHLPARLKDVPVLALASQPSDVYHLMWAGDFSQNDQALMVELHRNPKSDWLRIAAKASDGRFRDLVVRMLSRDAPELLTENQLAESQQYARSRIPENFDIPLWVAEILKQAQDAGQVCSAAAGLVQLHKRFTRDIG